MLGVYFTCIVTQSDDCWRVLKRAWVRLTYTSCIAEYWAFLSVDGFIAACVHKCSVSSVEDKHLHVKYLVL